VTAHVEPTRIPLENVFNLRDIGGYPTSQGTHVVSGRLFRADGLNQLSDGDAERIKTLGIRTVIDLRTHSEREKYGTAPSHLFDATVVHLPLIAELWPTFTPDDDHDPIAYLIERYHEMTVEGAPALARLVDLVALHPDSVPLVFHCSAGKDRTGVAAALILGLLGVADDVIAADYAHSSLAMADLVAWVRANHPDSANTMSDQPKTFLECPAEAMAGFLDQLAGKFGSMEGYAESIGITAATSHQLRDTFTA
jgi:protein tyrosine/serine phosphatase